LFVVDAKSAIIVADWSGMGQALVSGRNALVASLAVSEHLNAKDSDCSNQQDVNVAAFVQYKLENKPYNQNHGINDPQHLRKPFLSEPGAVATGSSRSLANKPGAAAWVYGAKNNPVATAPGSDSRSRSARLAEPPGQLDERIALRLSPLRIQRTAPAWKTRQFGNQRELLANSIGPVKDW
jgi:hypothetical protein